MAINFPNNPSNGDTHAGFTWNATTGAWQSAALQVATGNTAPTNPANGDQWFDTSDGTLYVYFNDGSSSQWVGVSGPQGPAGAAGAAGADGADGSAQSYTNFVGFPSTGNTLGDLAVAQDTKALYMWDGTEWDRISVGVDESPVIITEPPTTSELNNDGTTSTITMVAQDPEGFDIEYGIAYKTTGNALPSQLASATTVNANGEFTFTPTSNTSNAGSFRARLSASDGARTTTRFVDFSLDFTVLVDYLVVAGGGGGLMGGGGGGGVLQATGTSLLIGNSYAITVGAGGDGWKRVNGSNLPTRGGNSSIVGISTAIGGGAGGGNPGNLPTNEYQSGGSGGGAGHSTSTLFYGGKGIYPGSTFLDQARQGYDGGNNKITNPYGQGGGGGAGGAGGNASGSNSGSGGTGIVSSITGSNVTYAGGGGGGGWAGGTTAGSGGSGGGGAGSTADNATASNGTGGLGGGGGGGSIGGSGGPGGYGGSGIVIIRTLATAASTTGSPTVTTDGSYNIYSFTADGSITF